MVRKIQPLDDWISAHDAAQVLSIKYERPISPKYIRSLSKRKKQPVRIQERSNRFLYNRDDILATNIKQKQLNEKPEI